MPFRMRLNKAARRPSSVRHSGVLAKDELSATSEQCGKGRNYLVMVNKMASFSSLTMRNLLIATHDALATTLAVFASFYLRFEGDSFYDRLPLLLRILPYFVALSIVTCYAFN